MTISHNSGIGQAKNEQPRCTGLVLAIGADKVLRSWLSGSYRHKVDVMVGGIALKIVFYTCTHVIVMDNVMISGF